MTIIETSKITSKGQITIPNRIRKLLHAEKGNSIAFALSREGVILLPCKITVEYPYTASEWAKIEKLASGKGKIYRSARQAKKHIKTL